MGETIVASENVKISVIVPARNEARTIARVVREARKIAAQTEVIVVCNGSTDQTAALAAKAGAKVIQISVSLGHDVGRAIGASYAQGEILLFIDGDFVIRAHTLRQYTNLVAQGNDLVLNAYPGFQKGSRIHSTAVAKRFLNSVLGCPHLEGSSMTTVPHAMNRKALTAIGIQMLAVPPKAQASAIMQGLRVARAVSINTARVNRKRPRRKERVMDLVLGDHLEAIGLVIAQRGSRAGKTDFSRHRELLEQDTKDHFRWVYRMEQREAVSVGGD
ncbi:glycosyltransferase family 2 protein [Brevibacillus migulae]|uniref:glycosyltransferase family 2 protein n=1 Tax=Brevibacillus migulae TaxID=1644114 RepID=UPI001F1D0CF7|nr:glycosyltransferase family A protein [Brevibacillus migulae]